MEEDNISIRKLAKEAGVSPSLIQDIRSGKKENMTLNSFSSIIEALGYCIVLKRKNKKSKPHRGIQMQTRRKISPKTKEKAV